MINALKVLIADDSVAVRAIVRKVLESDPQMGSISTASNGQNAIERCGIERPDMMILDMNMPLKTGLEVVRELRAKGLDFPILLFSSAKDAPETLEALTFKKVDFLAKDESSTAADFNANVENLKKLLLPKIFQFFQTKIADKVVSKKLPSPIHPVPRALAIASSTGGPGALEEIFKDMHGKVLAVPGFIVQHMPPVFTAQLAERLSKVSGLSFIEAKDDLRVESGHIYIAPGGFHMELYQDAGGVVIKINKKDFRHDVRPSADFMFETAGPIYKDKLLSIVLTGMGSDGIDGLPAVKKHYGKVLIQSKESCVVFGMAKAVQDAGLEDGIENLAGIRKIILENFFK